MLIRPHLKSKKSLFSFKPDFITNSVTTIDFKYLQSIGITTCFVDLDGTVVHRGSFAVNPKITHTLATCGMDIKIATNRPRSRSLQDLQKSLHATGVIHPDGLYGKPTKKYLTTALKEYGLKRTQVVMVGDRYIQDILGANRSGIYSLLISTPGGGKGKLDRLFSKYEYYITKKRARNYHTRTK